MAETISITHIHGRCRLCSTDAYTAAELNAVPGQDWRCYRCFDRAKVHAQAAAHGEAIDEHTRMVELLADRHEAYPHDPA